MGPHRTHPSKVRILVTEPEYFTPESLRRMGRAGIVVAKRMSRPQLLRAVRDADALVVRIDTLVDRRLLAEARRLRCVVSATTGTNHIDTKALAARGIPLFSLHGTHSLPTAEHALALLFAAARNIPAAQKGMEHDSWKRWEYIGSEITGKTLGILGLGRIGKEVAARAKALGMRVVAYDPYLSAKEMVRRGAEKVSWRAFLVRPDFFSLHAPLTAETKGLMGKREFGRMKRSAILVNAARGGIVHERALVDALRKGIIRAAALDVYSKEPLPPGNFLRRYAAAHRNLVLTPHIAASTEGAVARASALSADSLVRFFARE